MKNGRLVQYLQLLPLSKLKKLRQFLLLFLSEKAQPIILFDALCKGLKKPKLLDNDYILNTAFKEETSKASLHNATNKLLNYVENFLLSLQLHTENKTASKNIERELIILDFLKTNKADDLYFSRLDTLIDTHKKAAPNNIWHTYECMRLKHDAYYNKRDFTKNKIDKKGNIPGLIGSLDSFYEDFSGKYYLESLVRSKITQEKAVKPAYYKENGICSSFYWKLIALFESEGNAKLFEEIKIEFEKKSERLLSLNRHEILLYLINYTIKCVRESDNFLFWGKKTFQLYAFGDRYNIFKKNSISATGFIAATIIATSLEKIEWSKKFIIKHQQLLPKKEKKDTLLFVNMYVLFTEKRYNEVIDLFHNQTDKNYQSAFRYKFLLLFSKYKSSQYTPQEITTFCKKEYNSMKNNTAFSESVKTGATNFFNCINALNKKKDSKAQIESKIQKKPLFMQFWLKKELKTYKKRE